MSCSTAQFADSQHPWIGLASFTEGDSDFFAGRGDEIEQLLRLVRRDTLTLLYGISGLGKTSLLQAGLFPGLRAEDYLPVPIRLDYREGAGPLAKQVFDAIGAAAVKARVDAPQPQASETLWEYFHRPDNYFWSPRNDLVTPFLAFDQFEEFFTLGRETADRTRSASEFVSELADLVENRPPASLRDDPARAKEFSFKRAPLNVLLSMREDYLGDLDYIRSRFRALGQNRLRLRPMGEQQAREVIALGTSLLANGAEDRIVKYVAGAAANGVGAEITVAPALLSLVLRQLNERRLGRGPDAKITPDLLDLEQEKILEDFYLQTLKDFPVGVRTFVEDKLLTASGYRNSCALDDALTQPDVTQPTLDKLVDRRLLAYEDRHRTRRVEVTHDVLLPIIKASRDIRLMTEARAEADRLRARQAAQRRKQRITAAVAGALALSLIATIVLAVVVFFAEVKANDQTKVAVAATKKTSEIASRGNVLLARYSKEKGKNAQALAQLAQALRLNPENREARGLTAAMLTQLSWHVPLIDAMRHDAAVNSAQFSPDGQRMVTASSDQTARLWDTATGKPIGEPMKHEKAVWSAQFSPDGQRVVTASEDQTARVWDAASGKPIGEPMKHEKAVNSAQFSPDGQQLATASKDKTARLWDAATGKPIGEPMKHEKDVWSAQFSPDGQRVVTASEDKTARLWDAATGKPIGEPMKHEKEVWSAQFSPDGQRVVTASEDKTARLWDAATGNPIGEPMKHGDGVWSAQFSPDGQRVVTAAWDQTARLWDAATGKPIGEIMKHEDSVSLAQFSPDGQRVVTAAWDQTARLWDAATGKPIGEPMKHEKAVNSAQFSPDGQRIVTASEDKTARLWNTARGKPVGELMRHEDSVSSAQFSPDGQRIVTASADQTARLWDAGSSEPVGEPMKHEKAVNSAQFSPDGQRVVTASEDKTARLWDALTGKQIGEPMKHEDSVSSAQFSPDGQRIVTASADQTARLWDAGSSEPVGEPMKHEKAVNSAQFSPDGQRVVTASEDKTARLWDALTGKQIGEPMMHEEYVNSAQFSPDGQRVVTASEDKTARLWDAATGKPIGEPMKHESVVSSAQFSPDGQRIVTAAWDNTARLWDAATGKPIGEPMKHEDRVNSAQFSPDGQRIVTASKDKTARLWTAASSKPNWEPMKHEDSVSSAKFSPDGQRVVTASANTVRLWDVVIATDQSTKEDILLLAELAEATGGVTLETVGQGENLRVLTPERIRASRQKIAVKFLEPFSKLTPLQRFMEWSVSDRRSRMISPFSQVTVSEWLENRIKEGTVKRLRDAMELDPANARVTAYLGRRLADLALKQGSDPNEARRARGEADFLTSRAQKLAPDNDEVKKLRDEVVKLLELKTD